MAGDRRWILLVVIHERKQNKKAQLETCGKLYTQNLESAT